MDWTLEERLHRFLDRRVRKMLDQGSHFALA